MKKKSSRTLPPPLRALLPAVLFTVACLLPAALPADWFLSRAWRGYYTVNAGPSARERLALLGPAGVVSRRTATVSFNAFSGHQTVVVADLAGRLDPADPRRDPYLTNVEGYFQSRDGAGERAFLRTGRQPLVQLKLELKPSTRPV